MKIVCVCGMGLGSSVIAKMNIEQVLKKMQIEAQVDTCDVGSIRSISADVYVTTRELIVPTPPAHFEKSSQEKGHQHEQRKRDHPRIVDPQHFS
ncbi:PTS sugar transporter subunit IIB [Erwinia amylovora]